MRLRLVVVSMACVCAFASVSARGVDATKVDVLTYHGDVARTGQNVAETILTPAALTSGRFRRLASLPVDGYVYAQPLAASDVASPRDRVRDLLIVATEHDSVYAFDVGGKSPRRVWRRSLAPRGERAAKSSEVGCEDLVPEIGITSTPVIDRATDTVYVVAKTRERRDDVFHQYLWALDLATGATKAGGPAEIVASAPGVGDGSDGVSIAFDPRREHQRAALLLVGGAVVVAWASHCDVGPYHGWVMRFDSATLERIGVYVTTPDGGLGGVWQSGCGISADASGDLFFATGNGTFDATGGGADYGDSALRMSTSGGLSVVDSFTPFDQADLDADDRDLGSGGLLLLPDQTGAHPHEAVFAGKSGTIYVLDRDEMGGFHKNDDSQIVQSLRESIGGLFGAPAYWNGRVYFHGMGDDLKCFALTDGLLSDSPVSASGAVADFPGSTPTISANGTTDAVVWEVQTDMYADKKRAAVLYAFDALDLTNRLWSSELAGRRDRAGLAVKFAVPTVANGKVYVGCVKRVVMYGLK
jgi:hypothetical protein